MPDCRRNDLSSSVLLRWFVADVRIRRPVCQTFCMAMSARRRVCTCWLWIGIVRLVDASCRCIACIGGRRLWCQSSAKRHTYTMSPSQRALVAYIIPTYWLPLVGLTVQTIPSCVQETQGTPVSVMLHRTFLCLHFSQATEARERRTDIGARWSSMECDDGQWWKRSTDGYLGKAVAPEPEVALPPISF
jgi:hypothetical protein